MKVYYYGACKHSNLLLLLSIVYCLLVRILAPLLLIQSISYHNPINSEPFALTARLKPKPVVKLKSRPKS